MVLRSPEVGRHLERGIELIRTDIGSPRHLAPRLPQTIVRRRRMLSSEPTAQGTISDGGRTSGPHGRMSLRVVRGWPTGDADLSRPPMPHRGDPQSISPKLTVRIVRRSVPPMPESFGEREPSDDQGGAGVGPPPSDGEVQNQGEEHARTEASIEE